MSPAIKTAEKAYTILEAAELKGISPDYIRAAIKATSGNTLPAKRIGRGYRIGASALESWWANLEDA